MEEITMKTWPAIITALFVTALTAMGCATQGPPGTGWTTLVDGTASSMNNFYQSGAQANWRVVDGTIQADKGTGKGTSHLVSKNSYRDFQIWAEFWADHTTNSGIFIRVTNTKDIGSKNAYEVNIYDQRPDPSYGTGAIVNFAKVDPMPKAAGKWNTFLITAKGDDLTVEMNGVVTAKARNGQFKEGPFSLQFGGGDSGVIKWRKVMVRPL
jgi:hypothetical protein